MAPRHRLTYTEWTNLMVAIFVHLFFKSRGYNSYRYTSYILSVSFLVAVPVPLILLLFVKYTLHTAKPRYSPPVAIVPP